LKNEDILVPVLGSALAAALVIKWLRMAQAEIFDTVRRTDMSSSDFIPAYVCLRPYEHMAELTN